MVLHRHQDLERASPAPGLFRIIVMDEKLGSGAITQGMVWLEPGRQTRRHTHRVEESMTLLEGRLRVLIGTEVAEVDAPATSWRPRTPSMPSETSRVPRRCCASPTRA